jgi:hypothetical protein
MFFDYDELTATDEDFYNIYNVVIGSTAGTGASHRGSFLVRASDVPGPSIIALFGLGLVGLGFARRRRQV